MRLKPCHLASFVSEINSLLYSRVRCFLVSSVASARIVVVGVASVSRTARRRIVHTVYVFQTQTVGTGGSTGVQPDVFIGAEADA